MQLTPTYLVSLNKTHSVPSDESLINTNDSSMVWSESIYMKCK